MIQIKKPTTSGGNDSSQNPPSSGGDSGSSQNPPSGGNQTPSTVAVTGISLNVYSHAMDINDTFTLSATVSPSNATNKTVTWSIINISSKF